MRLTAIALVLCACAWTAAGDLAHLKSKARLVGRLAHSKHHKRGVLSAVPPYKLGHDIPLVTHSLVKPLVVTYPPTAAVAAVKVPLSPPLPHRYPVGVGHRVPVPHPHYGLKFPHATKAALLPKPDHHFHHHHHHVARPLVPVVPSPPVVPLPAPTATIAHPLPAPSPPIAVPTAVVPQPPPLPFHGPPHIPLRPLIPPAPAFSAAPAPVVAPTFPIAPQIPYILRPGGAIQSSLFATYPRYPYGGFQSPVFPLSSTAFTQIVPHAPQFLVPQADAQEGVVVGEQAPLPVDPTPAILHAHGATPQPGVQLESVQPGVQFHTAPADVHPQQPAFHFHPEHPDIHFQPGQPAVHLHPAQPDLQLQPGVHFHNQPDVHLQPAQPGFNFQPTQPELHIQPGHTDVHFQNTQPDYHFQAGHTDVHLQPNYHFQGGQEGHLQPGQPEYHFQTPHTDVHLQPQPNYQQTEVHQHSNQPEYPQQPEYAPGQPAPPAVDTAGWSPVGAHGTDGHGEGQYAGEAHHQFTQEQGQFEQHVGDGYDYQAQLQHHIQQQLEQAQRPAPEYGAPAEGRSAADEDPPQLYHNHIPLGLQPPIDRPLDHFH